MKILITGAGGKLGSDLSLELRHHFTVIGLARHPAKHLPIAFHTRDLTQPGAAQAVCREEMPDVIFHAAAMTDVDGCERKQHEALQNNFEAAKAVADAANQTHAFLIFFSTDYVFDGQKEGEYTEQDVCHPINFYGETKYRAEKYICERSKAYAIFRISWLFGLHGKSFPRMIAEKAQTAKNLDLISDHTGRPTYSKDVARAFAQWLSGKENFFAKADKQIFHLANDGQATWAELAEFILGEMGKKEIQIRRIKGSDLSRPAARPQNSVLSLDKTEKILGLRMRDWRPAVREFLEELESSITKGKR